MSGLVGIVSLGFMQILPPATPIGDGSAAGSPLCMSSIRAPYAVWTVLKIEPVHVLQQGWGTF